MTNPYQSPTVVSGTAVTPGELSALPPLRGAILTLRIVVSVLALGVIVFGAFTILRNLGQPQTLGGKLDTIGLAILGFGLFCGMQGIVLPSILFRFVVKPNPALLDQFADHGPKTARILAIQNRVQTATIVGCACFEGGAFANLVWYMNSGELVHLALAGVMLLGILARFPLPGVCERRIADELRRQDEVAGLMPPAVERSRER